VNSNCLVWSVAAGAGTLLGTILVLVRKEWGDRGVAFFLGLAAGVMLAVVALDLVPSILVGGTWREGLLGLASGGFSLAWADTLFQGEASSSNWAALGYLVMLGIALHDFPEGIAIALGTRLKVRTGMAIAMGVGIHNIPEGMAMAVPLLNGGVSRVRVLLQVLLVATITPLGTIAGQAAIAFFPAFLPFLLGVAAGAMLYLVFYHLIPGALRLRTRASHLGFWLGVGMIVVVTYI